MSKDPNINKRINRVEAIIEQLDADECSRDKGEELYKEGHRHLAEIRGILSDGDGDIVELE